VPALEFTGQSTVDDDNLTANTSRLINIYRQSSESGPTMQTVLGTQLVQALPSNVPSAMAVANERLFFLSGETFYELSESNVLTARAQIPYDPTATISANNEYAIITSRGVMYSWDTELNILRILDAAAFTDIGNTAFLGQRTFSSQRSGRQFQWSELIDPTNVNGLSFATAESKDDDIVRIASINGLLWIFGTRSIERWYPTGTVDIVSPMAGGTIERGLREFNAFVATPQSAGFIGSDGKIYIVDGSNIAPVSTAAVESTITRHPLINSFTYTQDGNQFLCWVFEGRPAWCYNLTTGEWNERASGEDGSWTLRAVAECYGRQYGLDSVGNLVLLVDNFADVGQPLIRTAISRTLSNEGQAFRVRYLELLSVPGSVHDLGRGPAITLEMSKNRGITWNQPQQRGFGDSGEYNHRIQWRALGRFPAFATAKLSWSDPVNLPLESTVWVEIV
jgi:hypothetical protein